MPIDPFTYIVLLFNTIMFGIFSFAGMVGSFRGGCGPGTLLAKLWRGEVR